MKKNKSFNQKKPKSISTDNNIFNCEVKTKEDINKNKINIPNNKKKLYNNYMNENNNIDNNKILSKKIVSYTKINKNRVNPICTYENQKKNTSLLIRNKTNENFNKSKEDKSNLSNYKKRKNYNVPKVKTKSRANTKQEKDDIIMQNENEDEGENEKEKNISKLIQNQEVSYLREIKKLMEEGNQNKHSKNLEIKRKLIEENGIDFDNFCTGNNEEEEKEGNENVEEFIKIKGRLKEKKYNEIKNNKNIIFEANNNTKKNENNRNKEKKENFINDEIRNVSNENKSKIINYKIKNNLNRNNNLNIQNNFNINNSSNNNCLILQNENINMNLSGSSEKNNIEKKETENEIINKYNQYHNIKLNNINYNEQMYNKREKRKQQVNTYEFLNKIISEMNPPEIKDKNKKEYFDNNMVNNDSLGESFRKSIHSTKNEEIKINTKNTKKIKYNSNPKTIINKNDIDAEPENLSDTEAYSGFNYNGKKNKRSKPEIQEYMEKQKKMKKLEEEKNLKNNQAKKLNKYLGLFKLQEGINLNVSKNRSKIYSFGSNTNIQNKKEIKDHKINNNNKEKIPNEYYFGKNNLLKRKNSDLSKSTESSQSTILDENNYYINLITSKNILSFNYNPELIEKRNNISDNKNNDINNNINDNIDNNNIRITTKDKDIQNTYNVNTNTSNNKISQEINERNFDNNMINDNKNKVFNADLFVKCKETLQKANQLFSKSNIDEQIKNYKSNYEEINNIYNNEKIEGNKSDNNIEIEENNQIINTQINKSDSKNEKSIKDEIYQNNDEFYNQKNNENIEGNIINKLNDNNVIINQNFINNDIKKFNQITELNNNNQVNIPNLQNEKAINENNNNMADQQIIKNNNNKNNYINNQQIICDNNNNEKNNEDIKEMLDNKKAYFFSQDDLENYYKIFISLDDYLKSLTKKNALNDIISYGDLRYTYKIGFEHIIFLLKSYPFNLLRLIYQRQYYKDVLRQFFIPFLRRAFNNINIYTYNKQKFLEVNRAIEQIYRIVFLKRLIFYGKIKQLYIIEKNILNEMNKNNNDEKQLIQNKNILINTENINNHKNNEKEKLLFCNKEKIDVFVKILQLIFKRIIISKLYYHYICLLNIDKKNENQASEKSNISSQRYNTYIYESFSEKSSLTAYPNSEGSARLHKVCELLEMQRKPQLEEENNNLSELANDSIQSIKSSDFGKNKKMNDNEKQINFKNDLIDKKEENNLKNNLTKKEEDTGFFHQNEIKIIKHIEARENNKNKKENEIIEEDGLNIPYKEIVDNFIKIKEKNKDNDIIYNKDKKDSIIFKNENINGHFNYKDGIEYNEKKGEQNTNNKIHKDNGEEKKNLEIKYENLPRKIENDQYKKLGMINDNSKNSNKYIGCVKKIEISNNLKICRNSQQTIEDISASKESNLIDWEFNNTNNNPNNISSKRDKTPLVNDLLNSKKDDLLNSSEFNSNIREGILEENDIIINNGNEKVKENKTNNINNPEKSKDIIELNEKKSRNNLNDNKNEIKEINENNDNNKLISNINDDIIKNLEGNNYQVNLSLSNSIKNNLNSELNNNISNSNNCS